MALNINDPKIIKLCLSDKNKVKQEIELRYCPLNCLNGMRATKIRYIDNVIFLLF